VGGAVSVLLRCSLAIGAMLLSCAALAGPPSFEAIKAASLGSEATLLDRQGEVLQRWRVHTKQRRLHWVPLHEVSWALQQAVLASEDQRFFDHQGIDWAAIARATQGRVTGLQRGGASTVSMQVAALIDPSLRRPSGGRDPIDKTRQMLAALALERWWSKPQILEAYLNLAPWRGEWVGIDAASQLGFGRDPGSLDAMHSALLAAMLRAPNASPDLVAQRACSVLRAIDPQWSCDLLPVLLKQSLSQTARYEKSVLARFSAAPHYARQLGVNTAGAHRSTLDGPAQRAAVQSLDEQLRRLASRGVRDGAIVALDNATGEALVWVGSSGAHSTAAQVDMVLRPRQTGSLLKPFLYGLAIDRGVLTAASLIDDSPLDLSTPAGQYTPQNHDRRYKGLVTVRAALGSSLNIPAVRTIELVGPDALFSMLRALEVRGLRQSGSYYGNSLALGSAEIDLLTLTRAYRILATGGVAPGGRVLGAGASFIVADMLADRQARALSFGTESILSTRLWSAVKTGTSKDMRDNWCIGFSERFTVGVWVGNAQGEPMHDVSGTTGAAPVWAAVMQVLHRDAPSHSPKPPLGVVQQRVALQGQASREADRMEWFVKGTEPIQTVALQQDDLRLHIAEPSEGSRLAIDPDMPVGVQKLTLRAQGAGLQSVQWKVNGKVFGSGPLVQWPLRPGQHQIELWRGSALVETRVIQVAGLRAEREKTPPVR
jgi:penicillin-binding protein 1C